MNQQERECPQCGEPIVGRANKVFCSAACRAQHFRDTKEEVVISHQAMEPSYAVAPATVQGWISQPIAAKNSPATVPNWLVEYQRTEIIRQEELRLYRVKKECDSLHYNYSNAITNCLKEEGSMFEKWMLTSKIGELDKLSTIYRTHPHLRQADSRTPERLNDIYCLLDTFRALLEKLQNQPGPSYLAATTIRLEFTPEKRARLRANLIPD